MTANVTDSHSPACKLDRHGWLLPAPGIQLAPSPNSDQRPADTNISLLVIHNITLPPGVFGGPEITDLFLNRLDYSSHPWLERLRDLRVSAHFLIRRDGSIVQYVATEQRAWHAGVSLFENRNRCNDFSLGIELEGTDTVPFEDAQYATLQKLTQTLRQRYPLRAVRGHEHIAPGRKTDPGPCFDWNRYMHMADWPRRLMPPA